MPWRRATSVFAFILLGALATGLGMGLVLLHARSERDDLQEQVRLANAKIESLLAEHTKLIDEASIQVTQAETARKSTQAQLDAMTAAESAWNSARSLPSPDARLARTWKDTLSLGLGVSVHTPAYAPAAATDQALTATINGTANTAGDLWLSLTRYSSDNELSLRGQLMSTTTATYRLGNRLLRGTRGVFLQDRTPAYVLRIEERGVPAYLVWIRAVAPLTEPRLLEILSTLTFAS